MNFILRKLIFLICILSGSYLFCDASFVTNFNNPGMIYLFDASNLNIPVTAYSAPPFPDNITFSPNGRTVYFTAFGGVSADVYSFPTNDPSVITRLNTGLSDPVGIAISSDGSLGFSAQDFGTPALGIYSFPTAGVTHTPTLLTSIGTPILRPLFIVISGDNAFVGDYTNGTVYSVVFTSTTYDATLIQTFSGGSVGGLAISSDGYLYICKTPAGKIFRVPLSNPTATPIVVATPSTFIDGLAVSNDGKTVFFTRAGVTPGVYSFPTDQGFPAPVSAVSDFTHLTGIDIAIKPAPLPPNSLTGSQHKNDCGLVFERFNLLNWNRSISNMVVGYYVYRNGRRIATLNASTFSYKDHNIKKGITTMYSVSSFDSNGNESALKSVTVN